MKVIEYIRRFADTYSDNICCLFDNDGELIIFYGEKEENRVANFELTYSSFITIAIADCYVHRTRVFVDRYFEHDEVQMIYGMSTLDRLEDVLIMELI